MRRFVSFVLSAIATAALSSGAALSAEAVKIGVVLSLSGPAAVFGIPERDAIQVAFDKLKADGKLKRPIELVIYDDKTNPTEATRMVTQAINNDKVVAIIGPGTGGNILAAGPLALRMQVPLLGPAGTMAITDHKNEFYRWVFRVAPSDRVDVKVILEDMAKSKAKKIGVFFQEDAYGKTGVDFAKEIGPTLGMEVVETVSAPYAATDLTAQATRLRNAGVEAVFLQVSISSLGASFVKAAKQVGLTAPAYTNAGLAQRSFAESVGSDVDGLRVLSIGNLPYDPSDGEAELAKLLKQADKVPQGWGELVGTNGLMTVVAAVNAQGDNEITGASMRDAIEGLCSYPAFARGKPCFSKDSHDGWAEDSLVITELRNKELKTRR